MDIKSPILMPEELQNFAEDLVDCVLTNWNLELCTASVILLRDGRLVKSALEIMEAGDSFFLNQLIGPASQFVRQASAEDHQKAREYFDSSARQIVAAAIEKRDRLRLIQLSLRLGGISREQAELLLNLFRHIPDKLRHFANTAIILSRKKSGPAPKLPPAQYPRLANRGTELAPVIFKLMELRAGGSQRTLEDLLDSLKNDHPRACVYLHQHIDQLKQALIDKQLSKRATKPSTRASAIADSVAGAQYGYDIRTSYERAREGRRMIKRSKRQ